MSNGRFTYLFDRYRSNQCSPEEVQELSVLCLLPENQAILEQLAERTWKEISLEKEMPSAAGEEILKRILKPSISEEVAVPGKLKLMGWKRIAAAASVVGIIFISYWLMKDKTTEDGPQITETKTYDVKAPDKNRAQITLADGSTVYLDSVSNGELVNVNGVKVVKTGDGRIEYSGELGVVSGELKYNTLYNPRGSKVIDMTLADGSRVWLNAGSSVTYPVAFVGKERKVSITGEAYFEISTSPQPSSNGEGVVKRPFIVSKGDVSVTVLGTHFNVNAYDDEPEIKVTLLEGSVKVSTASDPSTNAQGSSKVIKPGEQAVLRQAQDGNGQLTIDKNVNTEEVMAWKNGKFSFNRADIQTVMRELARWYDLEVVYEGTPTKDLFGGDMQRNLSLQQVLDFLRKSQVHFEVSGRKVIVKP